MKASLPKCFVFVFQKHMVDVSYFIPFSGNQVMPISQFFLYFSNHSIRDTEECNFPCYNLANLKTKHHLSRVRCFKVFCILKSLRRYQKSLQARSASSELSPKVKESLVPALIFGNILYLVNLISLVSISTLLSDLRSVLPKCSPHPCLSTLQSAHSLLQF